MEVLTVEDIPPETVSVCVHVRVCVCVSLGNPVTCCLIILFPDRDYQCKKSVEMSLRNTPGVISTLEHDHGFRNDVRKYNG